MDINENMELEEFELLLDRMTDGIDLSVNSDDITEEMVSNAIKNNLDNNRRINRNVDIAIYDSLRCDLVEYLNTNTKGL